LGYSFFHYLQNNKSGFIFKNEVIPARFDYCYYNSKNSGKYNVVVLIRKINRNQVELILSCMKEYNFNNLAALVNYIRFSRTESEQIGADQFIYYTTSKKIKLTKSDPSQDLYVFKIGKVSYQWDFISNSMKPIR